MNASLSPPVGKPVETDSTGLLALSYDDAEVPTMATVEERRALLAVTCRWCGAALREECRTNGSARPITTLDGGCHDLRWKDALGHGAQVVRSDALPRTPDEETDDAPVLAGVGPERPW